MIAVAKLKTTGSLLKQTRLYGNRIKISYGCWWALLYAWWIWGSFVAIFKPVMYLSNPRWPSWTCVANQGKWRAKIFLDRILCPNLIESIVVAVLHFAWSLILHGNKHNFPVGIKKNTMVEKVIIYMIVGGSISLDRHFPRYGWLNANVAYTYQSIVFIFGETCS